MQTSDAFPNSRLPFRRMLLMPWRWRWWTWCLAVAGVFAGYVLSPPFVALALSGREVDNPALMQAVEIVYWPLEQSADVLPLEEFYLRYYRAIDWMFGTQLIQPVYESDRVE